MNADGSVVIEINANDTPAQRKLNQVKEKVEKINNSLQGKESDKSAIAKAMDKATNACETTRSTIKKLKAELKQTDAILNNDGTGYISPDAFMLARERQSKIKEELAKQEALLQEQTKTADSLAQKYQKAEAAAAKEATALESAKSAAGELEKQLAVAETTASGVETAVSSAGKKTTREMSRAEKSVQRFGMRLREVIRSAMIFTLISQAFAQLRSWLGKVITSNSEAAASIAKLKGALLTAAQPILQVLIPAFVTLVNVLTTVVTAFAKLFALLTGTTLESSKEAAKALGKETAAISGTGAAADKAGKSLAGFDTINKLSSNTASGGGGGASSSGISPDFNFDADKNLGVLEKLLPLVEAIGAAFAAWQIGHALGKNLGEILGLALAIYSAAQFVEAVLDAWNNGLDWDNLIKMLVTATGVVVGLGIAFGPVGAAIGAIVTGLTMLVVAFHDADENGVNLKNTLLAIAGIMATGIGIAVLAGSWIPILIAAIASILLAITNATGHGEELIAGIKKVLEGFKNFFVGVFTGDLERAINGISQIFEGLDTAVSAVFDGLRDMILSFLDWLNEKTGGRFSQIIDAAKFLVSNAFQFLKESVSGVIGQIKDMLSGVVTFITGVFTLDWDTAWEGIKMIFKGAWNGMISLLESAINFIIRGVNKLIDKINDLLESTLLAKGASLLGLHSLHIPPIREIGIPRLATGAVIPPNREFMAVLGDQKQGTNIETPLETMIQAFRQALAEGSYGGKNEAVLMLDGEILGRIVYQLNSKESKRVGVSLAEV